MIIKIEVVNRENEVLKVLEFQEGKSIEDVNAIVTDMYNSGEFGDVDFINYNILEEVNEGETEQ